MKKKAKKHTCLCAHCNKRFEFEMSELVPDPGSFPPKGQGSGCDPVSASWTWASCMPSCHPSRREGTECGPDPGNTPSEARKVRFAINCKEPACRKLNIISL